MTKAKNTKRALFASVISMVLCVAMLVGSTFAWFTDSVTSGMNKIVAGNLDIELYHSNGRVENEKVDESTMLFVNADGSAIQWEPGAMVYETFTVKNAGSLALKYKLTLKAECNTVDGKSLKDVLKVAILDEAFTGEREDAQALTFDKTVTKFQKDGRLAAGGNNDTYAVVIYWEPSDADNDYNFNNERKDYDRLFIDLGVTLAATQDIVEKDGFDDQYDFLATLLQEGYVEVGTAADLETALKDGKNVILTEDIDAAKLTSAGSIVYGNGKTIYGTGRLGLNDVSGTKFVNVNFDNKSGWAVWGKDADFVNCTFSADSSPYIAPSEGKSLTFEGCTFNTVLQICYNEGANKPETNTVTIKNCVFNVNNENERAHAIVFGGGTAEYWSNVSNITLEGNTFNAANPETSYVAYYLYANKQDQVDPATAPKFDKNTFNGNVNYAVNSTELANQYPLNREVKDFE